ncbi:hypothetical protein [Mucilaginibacter sp.]
MNKLSACKPKTGLALTALLLATLIIFRISLPVYPITKSYTKEAADTEHNSDEKDSPEKQADSKSHYEKELYATPALIFSFSQLSCLPAICFSTHQINYIPQYYATIHLPPPDFNVVISS